MSIAAGGGAGEGCQAIPCLCGARLLNETGTTAPRARVGACAKCGYDRAGLAPDAKCPECGTEPG